MMSYSVRTQNRTNYYNEIFLPTNRNKRSKINSIIDWEVIEMLNS